MVSPDPDDVVIRQKHGNPSIVYLIGTLASPDQFILRMRDDLPARRVRGQNVSACGRG